MADIESKSAVEDAQQEIGEKALTLSQKQETNADLVQTIQELEWKINKTEKDIWDTERNITKQNQLLSENEAELTQKTTRIGEINKTVSTNEATIGKKTSEINGIDAKIAELEKKKNRPENFEAVSAWSEGNTETENIDTQITTLQTNKKKLQEEIVALKAANTKLGEEKIPLEARQRELQETIIPQIKTEIARLTELKAQQEADKRNLVTEKNDTQRESEILTAEIQTDIAKIEQMAQKLSQARALYERNIAQEALGKKNLFEEMTQDFVGVLA